MESDTIFKFGIINDYGTLRQMYFGRIRFQRLYNKLLHVQALKHHIIRVLAWVALIFIFTQINHQKL